MNAKDWAARASKRFMEREQAKADRWAQALSRRQTLVSQAPVFWNEIREVLREEVRVFNDQVGKQVLSAIIKGESKIVTMFVQTDKGPRAMTIAFDADKPCIVSTVRSKQGEVEAEDQYLLELSDEGDSIVLIGGSKYHCADLAGRLLDSLMSLDPTFAGEPGNESRATVEEASSGAEIAEAISQVRSHVCSSLYPNFSSSLCTA